MKTCVATCAVGGYHWDTMAVFFNSLRGNGYDGPAVVFTDRLDSDTRNRLWSMDVQIFDNVNRRTGAGFFVERWYYYIDVLKAWDWALLADVRDVVFQGNPIDLVGDGLHVTEEAATIGEEKVSNAQWIRHIQGDEGLSRVANEIIICAGTVWGQSDAVMPLAEEVTKHYVGMDQGSINWAIRTGIVPATIHKNGDMAWTMGLCLWDKWQLDDKRIAMADGHVPLMIHQYDRVPEMKVAIESVWRW